MHFLLTTLKVVYVLTTSMLELVEDATVEAIRIRAKWENDDYIYRGYILNEEGKNKHNKQNKGKKRSNENNSGSSSNKKPKLECWKCGKTCHFKRDYRSGKKNNANAGGSRKGSKDQDQGQNLLHVWNSFAKYSVSLISKAFYVLVDAIAWWIDSGATTHVCKDRCWFKTFDLVEDRSVIYMGDEHFTLVHGKGSVALEFSSTKTVTLFNVLYVPKLHKNLVSGPVLNKYGYKHVYESNKYILLKSGVFAGFGCYNNDAAFWKEAINDEIGSIMENNTWVLSDLPPCCKPLVIHNIMIHQMDVKTTFLNGDLDEEVYMKQAEGFVMSGTDQNQVDKTKKFLSSRFLMKDMGEADVILDCSPVSTPMDPIEKLKPNTKKPIDQLGYSRAIGCLMYGMTSTRPDIAYAVDSYSDASWINHVEDSSSTSGWVFLLEGCAISWASKKQTCISGFTIESEFVALVTAGKEAEWLRNLIHEIPIWLKPITPISIRCDSTPTMARAYSQIYNGKSRHLGVKGQRPLRSQGAEPLAGVPLLGQRARVEGGYPSLRSEANDPTQTVYPVLQFVDHAGRPRLSFMVDVNSSNLCSLLDACDNVAKIFMGSDSNSEWRPVVWRHVRSIFMDCVMVSTRPTADGKVSIDANHVFAGKHGINVMMVPRFSPDSNVAEVEEHIKSSRHTFIVYVRYGFLSGFFVTSLSVKANKIEVKFDKTSMQETPVEDLKSMTRSTNDFQKNMTINPYVTAMPDGNTSRKRTRLLDACDNVAKRFIGSNNNLEWRPVVWRPVHSIFMDCVMVSMRPIADGRVSIDANHEFAGKHGINVMMFPRFILESNVTEVKEQIKVDDVIEVDRTRAEALSNVQKFKEEDYTMFYCLVCHTNLLVVEAHVDLAIDGKSILFHTGLKLFDIKMPLRRGKLCHAYIQEKEKKSNVAEVEEHIKLDDVMEVDTITWYNNLSVKCLQATIREVHEEAIQKAMTAFNSMVIGTGSVWKRCEKRLHTFLRKELKLRQKLNVTEVEEQIKVDDVMKVDTEALSNVQKFKREEYTMFYCPVCHTNLLVVEDQVDLAVDGGYQKALAAFNSMVVGTGSVRKRCEKQKSNVAEVEEQIKVDDVMEVDTEALSNAQKFKEEDYPMFYCPVCHTNLLVVEAQKVLVAFNSMVVGTGSVRQRCEKRLHTFLRKELEKALVAFNSMVVGTGSVRQRCEKRLHSFLRKELKATIREVHKEAVQKALAAFKSMVVGTGIVRQICEKVKKDAILVIVDWETHIKE
uniref:Zinc finger, CCHC-type n=1 Tax=Tanacetum cinerariifolium TaxID=118510 RepID=A0A6L2MXT1_TANCI|nr:zinc finger, CCHC-type [Tanacetum cinerariifolium]